MLFITNIDRNLTHISVSLLSFIEKENLHIALILWTLRWEIIYSHRANKITCAPFFKKLFLFPFFFLYISS